MKMKKCCSKVFLCILALSLLLPTALPCMAAEAADPAVVTVDGTYTVTLTDGLDGGLLIEADMKKSSASATAKITIKGEEVEKSDSTKTTTFLELDLSKVLTDTQYKKISILYFKYTGQYTVYADGTPVTSPNLTNRYDSIKKTPYTGKFTTNASYGKKIQSIQFDGAVSLKNVRCSEAVRKYAQYQTTSIVNTDYTQATGKSAGDSIDLYGQGKLLRSAGAWESTGENAGWYKYDTNNYSKFVFANDPVNSGQLVMGMTEKSGDQRAVYDLSNVKGRSLKISMSVYMPTNTSSSDKAVGLNLGVRSTSGSAYNLLQFYLANGVNNNFELHAPGETNDAVKKFEKLLPGETWHDFVIYFDLQAQKYVVEYERNGRTFVSEPKIVKNTGDKSAIGIADANQLQLSISTKNASKEILVKNVKVENNAEDANTDVKVDFTKINPSTDLHKSALSVTGSDQTSFAAAAEAITLDTTNPLSGLTLAKNATYGGYTYPIVWTSSNAAVISNTGVVKPSTEEAKTVTMTAKITDVLGNQKTKEFTVQVPKVWPYVISGASGVTDSGLTAGTAISTVSLTRYAASGEGACTVVCALYEGRTLTAAAVKTLTDTEAKTGEVTFESPVTIPQNVTNQTKVKIFVLSGTETMEPLAEVFVK